MGDICNCPCKRIRPINRNASFMIHTLKTWVRHSGGVARYVGLLLASSFMACSSYEFGVFAQVSIARPLLIAEINCLDLSAATKLMPEIRMEIRSGNRGSGIVQFRHAILESCLPLSADSDSQSIATDVTNPRDSCNALDSRLIWKVASDLYPCPLVRPICLPSLRLPTPISCSNPKPEDKIEQSPCFLGHNQFLSWNDSRHIPLSHEQQQGYLARPAKFWSELCCEIASQVCKQDSDCQRGTCQKNCALSGSSCTQDSDCDHNSRCWGICESIGQNCETDADCARGEMCLRQCKNTRTRCTTDDNCSNGDICVTSCQNANDLVGYVGFASEANISYTLRGNNRSFRLLCQTSDRVMLDLQTKCSSSSGQNQLPLLCQ